MASDQLAYAPVRPEGDTAQERDDLRLPRQRAAVTRTAVPLPPDGPEAGPGRSRRRRSRRRPPARHAARTASRRGPHTAARRRSRSGADRHSELRPVGGRHGPRARNSRTPPPEPVDDERPTDPGAALCARILGQATAQREEAARAEREATERAAAAQAAREAAERKVREQAAAAKAAAEEKARAQAAEAERAEAERRARLARSYIKPVACGTLGAGFGETDPWANLHTGQDFTAPTGTPVHAVHGGTVVSAGWAGSYGYRVILALDDGTELWYCHLSTMVATEGLVTTGDTVGRVGATGNVPAPHLHLEVRPEGGAPIDPLAWLRGHDVAV